MEVYVDDILVKSTKVEYHIANLEKAFNELRHHHVKLNANKCTFGVTLGKFLRLMVM